MATSRKGSMTEEAPPEEQEQEQPQETDEVAEDPEYTEDEEYDSRKMDPEQELWPGGPNFAQVNEWKDKYGEVYVTSITPNDHIVWRTITRFEYRRLVKNLEQALSTGQVTQGEANLDNEESMAELCIIYPPYNRTANTGVMGGIASTISQQIMDASGFTSMEVRQL